MVTHRRAPDPIPRRLVGVGVSAVALFCGVGLLSAPVAAAHNYLTGSSPEDGSTLDTPPDLVELVFDQRVQEDFAQVAVLDDQDTYQVGEPDVQGNVVTQGIAELPAGEYTVSYRIVSDDGHPVSGTIEFSVVGIDDEHEPARDPAADAEPQPERTIEATATATPAANTDDEADGGASVTALIMFAVLGGLALLLARSRRNLRDNTGPRGDRPSDKDNLP